MKKSAHNIEQKLSYLVIGILAICLAYILGIQSNRSLVKTNLKETSQNKVISVIPTATNPFKSRIPVVLAHDGKTYYCDEIGSSAVKESSNALKIIIDNGLKDLKESGLKSAANCKSLRNDKYKTCSELYLHSTKESYTSCISEANIKAEACFNAVLSQNTETSTMIKEKMKVQLNNLTPLIKKFCS